VPKHRGGTRDVLQRLLRPLAGIFDALCDDNSKIDFSLFVVFLMLTL
jgi:uncharacterized protein YggT (Ycf19 family)